MLEFLEDLRRGPVKLLSEHSLLVELQVAKHLAEVAVDDILNRGI